MEGYEVRYAFANRVSIFYLCPAHYATRSVNPTAPEEIVRGPITLPDDALCANCSLTKEPKRVA